MLQLAAVFSDHMVLQREKNIVVFGIGEVGAIITVSIPERKLYASTTVKKTAAGGCNFRRSLLEQGSAYSQKIAIQKFIFRMLPSGKSGWLADNPTWNFR